MTDESAKSRPRPRHEIARRVTSMVVGTATAEAETIGKAASSAVLASVKYLGKDGYGNPIRVLKGAAQDSAARAALGNGPVAKGAFHFGQAGGDKVLLAITGVVVVGLIATNVVLKAQDKKTSPTA